MARARAAVILSLTLVAAALPSTRAVAEPGPAPERPKQVYRVAAIGDSLTDVRSHGGKYLVYLRKKCPQSRFDNYGKGGQNVQQMRRRFARDVLGQPRDRRNPKPAYSHVIVFGGVNDLLHDLDNRRSTDKILGDLDGMYGMARKAGLRVIGVTLSPWSGMTAEYNPRRAKATRDVNQWLRAQSQERKIEYTLDAHTLLSCGEDGRLCKSFENPWVKDGLHFNAEGHAKLGQALYDSVFSDCQ